MSKIRVVGCLIEYDGKILALHRKEDKSQGNTWGLPAGKVEEGESDIDAIIREIKEETGHETKKADLEFVLDKTWDFPEKVVEFPTYRLRLNKKIEVRYNPKEHDDYRWMTPEECYSRDDLVHGFHDLLKNLGYVKA